MLVMVNYKELFMNNKKFVVIALILMVAKMFFTLVLRTPQIPALAKFALKALSLL
jgi:hypothetical protein